VVNQLHTGPGATTNLGSNGWHAEHPGVVVWVVWLNRNDIESSSVDLTIVYRYLKFL
jgi:hypothetical protein